MLGLAGPLFKILSLWVIVIVMVFSRPRSLDDVARGVDRREALCRTFLRGAARLSSFPLLSTGVE